MANFIDEFRNGEMAKELAGLLKKYDGKPVTLMEVCGTHTMSISKYGIRQFLSPKIRLISGPGCPVCVTPSFFIDTAIELSRNPEIIMVTFGDMMRIPSGDSSLLIEKAKGADIRIIYSPLEALKIARENPAKKVVFLSVGFETTTPIIALTILKAQEEGVRNFLVLSANKTVPEALKLLVRDESIGIDGFIYPGHVSAVIGTKVYHQLAEEYGIPGVVTGFEPLDIISSILTLAEYCNRGQIQVSNFYSRVVKPQGNPIALAKMEEVFEPCDAVWRGIGNIPGSGLKIREKYQELDAWKHFNILEKISPEPKGCICGEILRGIKSPLECDLFGTVCTPEKPVGACMVSSEGTCAAYHKHGNLQF